MKVNLIGTGEAFNQDLCNSSVFIEDKKNILIDCGFTVPFCFWKKFNANSIDIIYYTHHHADHLFGTPALITRMIEEKRKKELIVIGQKNIKGVFENIINLAYPSILMKKLFNIKFYTIEDAPVISGIKFYFAKTQHSIKNYAVCIKSGSKCISISGDGAPTNALIQMYKTHKPNIIIQECFTLNKDSLNHTSLFDVNVIEKKLKFPTNICLTHISRHEYSLFKDLKYKVLKDGDVLNL